METTEKFMLREVFNPKLVEWMGNQFHSSWKKFDKVKFVESVLEKLDELQYGERSKLIYSKLNEQLPKNFPEAVDIINRSLGEELEEESISGYNGFYILPLNQYIVNHGIDYPELSLHSLYEQTKRFSSEYGVRPFWLKHNEYVYNKMKEWAIDENTHVRRWVSEGSRPRLPLGIRLPMYQKNPKPVIALLDMLKDDSALYVRRSVANNMNDIAKDNPDIAVSTLQRWNKEVKNENIKWLTHHALRTLLKDGHNGALSLQGYGDKPNLQVIEFVADKKLVKENESFFMKAKIKNNSSTNINLMIDYAVHFQKANGKTSDKVFKWTTKSISPNEEFSITKKFSHFRTATTRALYAGRHKIEIIANGQVLDSINVDVVK